MFAFNVCSPPFIVVDVFEMPLNESKCILKNLFIRVHATLYVTVGRSEITMLFIAFSVLFELFQCTEEFLSTFLRLLNISETSVHFLDLRTFQSFLYIL